MLPYAEGVLPVIWTFQHDNDPKHTACPVFTTGSRGARIISISGFKFFRQAAYGMKTRWFCSEQRHGCKAVVYTVEDEIVKYPVFIRGSRGARIICMSGFKFLRQATYGIKTRWYCRNQRNGCKAVLYTIEDQIIK
ncbi:hypothetical protein MSG28_008212 [Choristoneura fumiferana]|uniref:Uncharacterized protein n=1 Tax=Choristoneura fumiferana TaxID=7141 RepID=A0ACC0JAI6_CHOFU|nr:hypothetical protein MSG28_008212 [Choristoneura fumiferana]